MPFVLVGVMAYRTETMVQHSSSQSLLSISIMEVREGKPSQKASTTVLMIESCHARSIAILCAKSLTNTLKEPVACFP